MNLTRRFNLQLWLGHPLWTLSICHARGRPNRKFWICWMSPHLGEVWLADLGLTARTRPIDRAASYNTATSTLTIWPVWAKSTAVAICATSAN